MHPNSGSAPEAAALAFWTPPRVGVVLVFAAGLFWSTSGVLLKGLDHEAPAIAGLRAGIAGLVLAPFLRYLSPARVDAAMLGRTLLLLTGYTGTVLCFNLSIRMTTAANAIALVYTSPAWVFAFTWIAERRPSARQFVPIALILAGIAIILSEGGDQGSVTGNLIGLVAGAAYGTFTFFITRVRQPAIAMVSLCNLFAAAVMVTVFPGAFRLAEFSQADWAVLIFLGVFQIAAGHLCFTAALQRIPATQASILALVEPLINPLWVYLLLGEVPSLYGVAGLAVILTGLLADFWARLSAPPPVPRTPAFAATTPLERP